MCVLPSHVNGFILLLDDEFLLNVIWVDRVPYVHVDSVPFLHVYQVTEYFSPDVVMA